MPENPLNLINLNALAQNINELQYNYPPPADTVEEDNVFNPEEPADKKPGNNSILDETISAKESELLNFEDKEIQIIAQNTTDNTKTLGGFEYDNLTSIEPAESSFLFIKTGGYTYTTSTGASIQLDKINEDTFVFENTETGEIVIIGADDANIQSDSSDIKMTILNSNINKIKTGKGNDNITIENSTVKTVESDKGNNIINIKNSTIENDINSGSNEDYIYAVNSSINTIKSGKGNDDVVISNSTVANIDSGKGDDIITIDASSKISQINGGKGDDLISVSNSSAQKIEGGKGNNSLEFENANIEEIAQDKNNTIYEKTTSKASPYNTIDPNSIEKAKEITGNKISEYSDKELTPEQEIQALTIDMFCQNLENMKSQFEQQENEDGKIRDAYNWVKELTDMGVSKEDIKAAIEEQQSMIDELTSSLNGKGDASFEEVFEKWTGIKYDEQAVTKYLETSQMYSLAANGLYKADNFKNSINNAETMQEVIELYNSYYGNDAKEKLNEFLYQEINNATGPIFGVGMPKELYIDENNQIFIKYEDKKDYEVYDAKEIINIIKSSPYDFQPEEEFKAQFEKTTGKSIEELQNEYKVNQLKAFGSGNSFQKLIDKYCADQDGFADKLASAAQIGGIGLMAIGGIVTFVCPPAGVAMMSAGKYTALAGMFGDNAIEFIDNLSSENGLSKDEAWDLMKESITELALLYSGAKINGIAAGSKDIVLNATQSKTLAFLAEIGTDASLSLLSDLVITGEIDLSGEGISQLLGIITGLAGAKVETYTKEAFEAADVLYKNGDIDGAMEYLTKNGIPKKTVYNYYKATELENINTIFKETGDVAQALKALSQSKILTQTDIKNVTSELKLDVLAKNGIDISRYKGYDFGSAQGKLVAQDIDMYYKALSEGTDINDLMVPTVKNTDAGLKSTKIGDVFEVQGSKNIFIKTEDGYYQELDISKEAYCKLFPALDRYSSGQQASGDCYLVSSLNSMMANPQTRKTLLHCFSENPDGSITVKIPNSDTEIMIKDGQTIDNLGIESNKHMTGALGMQLLEYTYKVGLVDKTVGDYEIKVEQYQNKILDNYNEFLSDTSIPQAQRQISLEEYSTLCETQYNNLKKDVQDLLGKDICDDDLEFFTQFFDYFEGVMIDGDGNLTECGLELLSQKTNIPKTETDKLNQVSKMLEKSVNENQLVSNYIDNASYDKNINDLKNKQTEYVNKDIAESTEELGGKGGCSSDVFRAFYLYDSKYELVDNSMFLSDILSNPELADKYVMTAATKKSLPDSDMPLVENHAYSFEVRANSTTGEAEIIVTNPWNTATSEANKDIVLSTDEFKKYFDYIYRAETW